VRIDGDAYCGRRWKSTIQPAFNDRLLLGLKGTMSEARLHILKARMRGGQLNKAKRRRA